MTAPIPSSGPDEACHPEHQDVRGPRGRWSTRQNPQRTLRGVAWGVRPGAASESLPRRASPVGVSLLRPARSPRITSPAREVNLPRAGRCAMPRPAPHRVVLSPFGVHRGWSIPGADRCRLARTLNVQPLNNDQVAGLPPFSNALLRHASA